MTYTASEKSKHSGKPLELYRYNGTYQVFRYTSSPVPIMYQAPDEAEQFEYLPLATKRSAVQHTTQNDDTSEVTIDLPVTSELVAIYGFQISPPDLYLTIFRGHNPGEYVRYWQGHVENISVVRGTATIRVPSPLASALSADFPNVYYQTPCNHNLGDAQCKVDLDDWLITTAVVTAPGKVVNVTAVGAMTGKLVGGDAVLASGERRMIVSQVANAITVNYPFANANPGDVITLIAGCDLAHAGDCKTKFDNTINFGGFPYIPSENIFSKGLEPGKSVADNSCLPPNFEGWEWEWVWITQVLVPPHPGAGTIFSVLNTPDPYSLVSNDGGIFPAGPKFSMEYIVDGAFLYQRMKMMDAPVAGEYEVIIDPNNLYPATRYSFAGRPWNSETLTEYWTADGGAFLPGGFARSGTFNFP